MKIHSLKSDPFGKKQIFQKYSTNTEAQSVRTEQKNQAKYVYYEPSMIWQGKIPWGSFQLLWGQVVFPCHIIDCS